MHDTLWELREELRECLKQRGVVVLPPETEDPHDEESLRSALSAYLPKSAALVLAINEYCGRWPRGEPAGAVSLQIDAAVGWDISCFLWVLPESLSALRGASYADYIQHRLAGHIEQRTKFSSGLDFTSHICESLRERSDVNTAKYVLLVSNYCQPQDRLPGRERAGSQIVGADHYKASFMDFVRRSFVRAGYLVRSVLGATEGPQIRMIGSVRAADAIVVVCFDQQHDWVFKLLRQLMTFGIRDHQRKLVILAGAEDLDDFGRQKLGFQVLRGEADDELGQALQSLLR